MCCVPRIAVSPAILSVLLTPVTIPNLSMVHFTGSYGYYMTMLLCEIRCRATIIGDLKILVSSWIHMNHWERRKLITEPRCSLDMTVKSAPWRMFLLSSDNREAAILDIRRMLMILFVKKTTSDLHSPASAHQLPSVICNVDINIPIRGWTTITSLFDG